MIDDAQQSVTALGFTTPTPIQAKTIPLALNGRDICGCAATGTGAWVIVTNESFTRMSHRQDSCLHAPNTGEAAV